MSHRIPGYADMRHLLRFRSPIWSSKKRHLSRVLAIYDLRTIAKRSMGLVGRDYLYAMMADGKEGVDRVIEILKGGMMRTMKLLGACTLDELTPNQVTFLHVRD